MHHKKSEALQAAETMEDKMDLVIQHLERMDRRDKWRMWGSMFHSIIALLPMLFFVWSTWYLYAHFNEIMSMMMQQTAKNAAQTTGQSYQDVLQQMRDAFGGSKPAQ